VATVSQIEQQYTQDAQQAGFKGAGLQNILAIMMAESGGNSNASNTTGNSAGTDRGILQINSFYHPEVTDSCAYNPVCAFQAAYTISDQGTNFVPWSTYNSGTYSQYLMGSNSLANTVNATIAPVTAASTTSTSGFQDYAIQGLFIVGGLILVIMGFILMFRKDIPKIMPV
jgi:hypothetical protein